MSIAQFFKDKIFFITGATGFVGQPLVEKILFVAPEVARINVLIRPKQQFGGNEIDAQARLERELYGSSVFDRLRGQYGDELDAFLRQKLIAVPGDISQDDLGLSESDQEMLRDTVDIVINSAAVVSFDAPLDEALNLNVMAARRITEFARSCKKALFVHVSTAYVSGTDRKRAREEMYHKADESVSETYPKGQIRDLDEDIQRLREIIQGVERDGNSAQQDRAFKQELLNQTRRKRTRRGPLKDRIEALRKRWKQEQLTQRGMEWARQRGWNDTYTYTKALGEQMVMRHRGSIKTAIIRPSVIESSLAEPCPGWLDGLRMADPLIAAIGKGRLKALPLNRDVLIDLVPVDVVVNALLASIPLLPDSTEVRIYQVATGSRNPITLGELYDLIYRYFTKNPMLDKTGDPIIIRRLRFPNPATFRFQHRLKTVPLKTAERTLERLSVFESTQKVKRRLAAANVARQKLYYYGEIYEPYLNLDCQFQVDNTMALFGGLSPSDQRDFNFDVSHLNWRHYIQNVHIPGVKKFILKIEGVGTMELDGEGSLPVKTIPDLIENSATRYPDKPALQIKRGETWHRITYREVWQRSGEIASRLKAHGLRKGDRVVLFSENQPEWGLAYLAAVRSGLVVVPLDSQTWPREVWSVVHFTEASAILLSDACLARLNRKSLEKNEASENGALLLRIDQDCKAAEIEGLPRTTATVGADHEPWKTEIEIDPDDPVSIIFTQGTMVDPRGAIHTHRSFLSNVFGVNRYLPISADDSLLSVLPLYHALEFTCGFLMPLWAGATVSYSQALKPRTILALMREAEVTCLLGVPTLFSLIRDDVERRILKASESQLKANWMAQSKRLSMSFRGRFGDKVAKTLFARVHAEFGGKIRVFVSGGSALGPELYEDFRALGMPIYEGYGLTETAPVLTVNPLNLSRSGSAGKPLPGVEVRLDHPDKDGAGHIVVRTPSLMRGYFRNEAATNAVIEDGWFQTGDLGWVDVGGYIYITGRKKDVIVTGAGKNVYPVDLEAIFSKVLGVEEIAVVGVPKGLTEEVHALIRVSEDAPEDWDDHCREVQRRIQKVAKELPSYHRVQQFHFTRNSFPQVADQLDRKAVRQLVGTRLQASQTTRIESLSSSAPDHDPRRRVIEQLSLLTGVPVTEIDEESDLYTDLGLDSLRAIEMLLDLEQTLGVNIPDADAARLMTVGEVLDFVQPRSPEEARPSKRKRTRRPVVASALPFSERSWFDRSLLTTSFTLLKAIYSTYLRLETNHKENVPAGSPYIIATNHSSHLDTGAVISALYSGLGLGEARRIHVLGARDYFFDSAVRGWLVSHLLNVVPIERKESSLSSLRLVKSILSQGEPVLIYPEGTRNRSDGLQAFKPGLGLMAWELKVPILPVLLEGTRTSMPVGRFLPAPGRVRVTFGKPIEMSHYQTLLEGDKSTKEGLYRQIVQDVRDSILDLQASSLQK